ncbi:uncharacterized protein G2W53_003520 [Senna tora]|uniref:Uncharacterized protein n=1 Tax=Senna tora TaxID=362788 RepID=A0A834XB76_9FABA|nr:uncharacterized protein G2W53_003520 [Senna tora]
MAKKRTETGTPLRIDAFFIALGITLRIFINGNF